MIATRIVVPAVAMALLGSVTHWAPAQDDLQPTTELGVTVTPDHIFDAIQETTDFWPPVRAYVKGEKFQVATPASREATAAFLKQAHSFLHDQLFEKDEATAMDLIDYLSWRIRKFVFLRRIRQSLQNDSLLVLSKDDWEQLRRDANELPAERQDVARAAIPTEMSRRMVAAGVEGPKVEEVVELWRRIAVCEQHMSDTETGQGMLEFEQQAKEFDRATASLIRDVVSAAEWTLIAKPTGTLASYGDFQPAWDSLQKLRAAHTAATQPSTLTE